MNFEVQFSETSQSFEPKFQQIQTASDGGYERGYAQGYKDGYAEGSLVGIRIDFTQNLNVPENIQHDFYIRENKVIAYKGWSATDYIPVIPNQYIAVSSLNTLSGGYCAYYDENKNYLGKWDGGLCSAGGDSVVLLPVPGSYVRLSAETSHINALKVYRCS